MKIKEVIEKTKLTDRAIRLYIDNGLVSPGIEENYSGRKNIEFSESDVERLNQIALLRKAGFSISDIKEIISDDKKIEEIVRKFIDETDEEIRNKTEVVERLKSISFDEKVSLKNLCEKLSETVEEANVPEEDLNEPKAVKIIRTFLKIFAVVGIAACASVAAGIIIFNIFYYRYFCPSILSLLFVSVNCIGLFITSALFLAVWKMCKKPSLPKSDRNTEISSSIILTVIAVIAFFPSMIGAGMGSSFIGQSTTRNPDHYLVVDESVEREMDKVLEIFPGRIPSDVRTARDYKDSVRYYYYCQYVEWLDYDIVAEWSLSDSEYDKAKEDILRKNKTTAIKKKNNWTCLYFSKNTDDDTEAWKDNQVFYLIFAYNDRDNKVRYIASQRYSNSEIKEPYHISLDW